ncbi:hypothetical protein CYY_006646 [Polysphondylium violaceum]|uniref:S-adenosylmethionine-dependent methyltransferase domain-containing protein n=1 Tax=Polysphondylium violaceum TaxID=133409 RepID=A0A8J4PS77_9MYCE|nr:hypothetical protein CYY_006646 [Polysphondylium violaceum]
MNTPVIFTRKLIIDQLKKRVFTLPKCFEKDFQGLASQSQPKAFRYFATEDQSIKGLVLFDTTKNPPIYIMDYRNDIKNINQILLKDLSDQGKLDIGPNAAYRVVNQGGDGLPLLIVDVFGDFIQIETLSEAWDGYISSMSEFLLKELGKKGTYWKRAWKGISKHYMGQQFTYDDNGLSNLIIQENGIKYTIDLLDHQSTGFYLDHRETRKAVTDLFAKRESGSILNLFSHTSTFSMVPSTKGLKVSTYNVDHSKHNRDIAVKNFALNGIPHERFHRFIAKDVVLQLNQMKDTSNKFDVIILDPPHLVNSKEHGLLTTSNRYAELLRLALPFLNPGGFIFSFVDTAYVSLDSWYKQLNGVKGLPIGDSETIVTTEPSPTTMKKERRHKKELLSSNIKEAKFSPTTLGNQSIGKMNQFKVLEFFKQPVDFRQRPNDIAVNNQLSGLLLKHKIDFHQTKFFTKNPEKKK